MTKRLSIAIAAALGLVASSAAMAQSTTSTPWRGDFWGYIGASAGESKFRSDCSRTVTLLACDHNDTAAKVFAGGKFNPLVGLEIGYTDFGRISTGVGETKAWAVPVTLTLNAPIGERFNVFAKGGGLYARTDVRVDIDDVDDTFRDGRKNGFGWTYGAGAAFSLTQNIQIRADWDRHRLDFASGSRDVDMLSAGVQFRF